MKLSTRYIKSAIATAADTKTALPWERGARRASFIAARKATKLKSA
ncbi:hypothetical protein [Pseudaestuariivita sp.]